MSSRLSSVWTLGFPLNQAVMLLPRVIFENVVLSNLPCHKPVKTMASSLDCWEFGVAFAYDGSKQLYTIENFDRYSIGVNPVSDLKTL